MRALALLPALIFTLMGCKASTELPSRLADGEYVFSHRYAEHPWMESITLTARIQGDHIVLINDGDSAVFPRGKIEEGRLFWHAPSAQWIVIHSDEDREAVEVGGCSDGPEVIDLARRIYWTC